MECTLMSSAYAPSSFVACTCRTDDELDYYSSETNKWLSPEQRKALAAKEASLRQAVDDNRRTQRLTLDLAGRRVVDSGDTAQQGTAAGLGDDVLGRSLIPARNVQKPGPATEARLRALYASELEELNASSAVQRAHGPTAPIVANEERFRQAHGDEDTPDPLAKRRWGKEPATVGSGRVQHDLGDGSIDLAPVPAVSTEADLICDVDLRKLTFAEDYVEDPGLCLSMVPRDVVQPRKRV